MLSADNACARTGPRNHREPRRTCGPWHSRQDGRTAREGGAGSGNGRAPARTARDGDRSDPRRDLPALADSTPDPRPRTSAEVLRPVAPPPASNPAGQTGAVADGDGIETARTSRPVAPGVRLSSYDRLESDKWLRVDNLSVDLAGSGVRADYLSSGKVSERHTVSELAAGHDAGRGRRTVAAINADFFDINQTGAPEGIGIKDGATVQSPAPGSTAPSASAPTTRAAS